MNYTYLNRAFQENQRFILLYEIKDFDNGFFLDVGSEVEVLDIMIDPQMPSGYSALIEASYSDRPYFVDKDFLMPMKDFMKLYDKAITMFMRRGGF